MSYLAVYPVSTTDTPNKVLTHFDDIASTLAELGVGFQRWQAAARLEAGASEAEIIAAYQQPIDQLMTERGYTHVDVVSISNDHPQKAELRAERLDEHRLAQDHVRFFVAGRGLFNLHIEDYVYAVFCEKNDLIAIPGGIAHWFDMGENPHFVVIRLFNGEEGLAINLTGDTIATGFARLED
ncbi:acireductone dioxygenase [uncultured Pseudomonas sp.]|uniref:1,2-dihydroxy-3-keto-5-methylthiopentene dioxygenase n=1 Tax=uncultured Pseudomonas sp. TaxID=114707 RepID=UPI0025DAA306|nr:acireductone dioxygenase [uncultured Pseudomonas sp.]